MLCFCIIQSDYPDKMTSNAIRSLPAPKACSELISPEAEFSLKEACNIMGIFQQPAPLLLWPGSVVPENTDGKEKQRRDSKGRIARKKRRNKRKGLALHLQKPSAFCSLLINGCSPKEVGRNFCVPRKYASDFWKLETSKQNKTKQGMIITFLPYLQASKRCGLGPKLLETDCFAGWT